MSVQHSSSDLPEHFTRRRAIGLALTTGAGTGLTWAGAGASPAAASLTGAASPADVPGAPASAAPAGTWADVPYPAGTATQLFAVAAPAPRTAFAIGQFSWEQRDVTTALHWNGLEWVTRPVPPLQWNWWMDLAAASPRAAWVTGITLTGQAPISIHWNGSSWREVPVPRVGADPLAFVPAVSAEPGGTAWAVLSEGPAAGQQSLLRFEGGAWVRKQGPALDEGHQLMSIKVRSRRDVWIGATSLQSGAGSLTFHWNGSAWTRLELAAGAATFPPALDILPVSRGEVWAYAGQRLFRLDAGAWTKVADVPRNGMFPMAYGGHLVSDCSGGVWIPALAETVGSGRTGYLHWDGTTWSRVLGPSRDPDLGHTEARDMAAIPGTRSIWAVGVQGTGYAPFIERFTPA
ncbi:hypothetical protein [Spirillospora sp. NPDC047279]|uniref:hypothetical protein n=1 Tax=Spirillospora sp. NPDC047279 TaxID=3155478 RepID=UPI0033F3BF75